MKKTVIPLSNGIHPPLHSDARVHTAFFPRLDETERKMNNIFFLSSAEWLRKAAKKPGFMPQRSRWTAVK
jgi:hypothetical protein